jgi:hypothetical protein
MWVGSEGDEVSSVLWPTGELSGKVIDADGAALTGSVHISFQAAPVDGKEGLPSITGEHSKDCPLSDRGALSCELPGVPLDLKIRMEGHASAFYWKVMLPAGASLNLGEVVLPRGASVVGWIESEDAEAIGRDTLVLLRPYVPPGSTPLGDEDRQQFRTMTTAPDQSGFFQFSMVPPGTYVVVVNHPEYAESETDPLSLPEGAEATLREPLVMRRPLEVEITVLPTADPWGQPWTLQLVEMEAGPGQLGGDIILSEKVDPDSGFLSAPVPQGDYRLWVIDEAGNRWHDEQYSLDFGTAILILELSVVPIAGEVLIGDQPVQASVTFHRGDSLMSLRFSSDEDGLFTGHLPGPGSWNVRVSRRGTQVDFTETVDIPKPEAGKTATVTLRLPNTVIRGVVVDERGKPVSDANVQARLSPTSPTSIHRKIQTHSDADGSFMLRGIPEGQVFILAHRGEASSEDTLVSVVEDQDSGPVTLVIRSSVVLNGTVTASMGPVSRATIFGVPLSAGMATIKQVRTEVDGSFEMQLPKGAGELELIVMPIGLPLQIERIVVPDKDSEIAINVDDRGGRLILLWDGSKSSQYASRTPSLAFNNVPVPVGLLQGWATSNRGGKWKSSEIVLPLMPSGEYRSCIRITQGDGAGDRRCATGFLPPYGELSLAID